MATEKEFSENFGYAVMDWLDQWHREHGDCPRSDWIVFTLMFLAGSILAQAPDEETRRAVLVEALVHFGEASGANIQQLGIAKEQHTLN